MAGYSAGGGDRSNGGPKQDMDMDGGARDRGCCGGKCAVM